MGWQLNGINSFGCGESSQCAHVRICWRAKAGQLGNSPLDVLEVRGS